MQHLSHYKYLLDQCQEDKRRAEILHKESIRFGFHKSIFQLNVGKPTALDRGHFRLMRQMTWNEFDTAHWARYGIGQQKKFVRELCLSSDPIVLDVHNCAEYWDKKSDYSIIKQLFSRQKINGAIIMPIYQPAGRTSYIAWFCKNLIAASYALESRKLDLISLGNYFIQSLDESKAIEKENNDIELTISQKEWQCLYLAAKGLTEKEMARELTRSSDTVKFHLRNAMRKLCAKNRTHAVAIAIKMGIIKN